MGKRGIEDLGIWGLGIYLEIGELIWGFWIWRLERHDRSVDLVA
jgi:hypothetical protein